MKNGILKNKTHSHRRGRHAHCIRLSNPFAITFLQVGREVCPKGGGSFILSLPYVGESEDVEGRVGKLLERR